MFNNEFYNARIETALEELGYSALNMVVASVGGVCERTSHTRDAWGVDATCTFNGIFSSNRKAVRHVTVDFQLKSSYAVDRTIEKDGREFWSIQIQTDQLIKYSEERSNQLLLALFLAPPKDEFERWLDVSDANMILKKSLYWTPINGVPIRERQDSVAVHVPKANLLTPESLLWEIVTPISKRENLIYGQK